MFLMLKESFLEYLSYERRYSEHTVCSYGLDLSKFEEYLKGVDEDLDLIHVDADLGSWLGGFSHGTRLYAYFCESKAEFAPIVL